jgi:hypothetical protein
MQIPQLTVTWFNMYGISGLDGYDYLMGDNDVINEDEKIYPRTYLLPSYREVFSTLFLITG